MYSIFDKKNYLIHESEYFPSKFHSVISMKMKTILKSKEFSSSYKIIKQSSFYLFMKSNMQKNCQCMLLYYMSFVVTNYIYNTSSTSL